jgi:hypothetical protein
MDKVEKPSNSECYTPLSEPFRETYIFKKSGQRITEDKTVAWLSDAS